MEQPILCKKKHKSTSRRRPCRIHAQHDVTMGLDEGIDNKSDYPAFAARCRYACSHCSRRNAHIFTRIWWRSARSGKMGLPLASVPFGTQPASSETAPR